MTENNMPASIGVNLRVTGHCRQGGRKYMEDFFSVAYQQTEDEKDLEYAFFGIYDGHGGAEAAAFAKEHLMETIIKHKSFWSDDDKDVLRAIKDGYIATHYAMWRVQEKWPRTASGLPSTAGTTASVAFIRRGKIYIGHVGDSGIILGLQEPGCSEWKAVPLTKDHKPENFDEMVRIKSCGGKVVSKSGVPRVVWNRPKIGHQGPVRRSTPIDEIPFLAVARSLGDLWSYNYQSDSFIVSPDPDCSVIKINTNTHRCLIFGTDGLFNMLSPSMAVHIVQQVERHNENAALSDSTYKTWLNPSKLLVEKALERWHSTKMRADNTSVVTLMLDPPGPPRAQVLKDRKKNLPERGLKIMTRFDNEPSQDTDSNNCDTSPREDPDETLSQTVLEPEQEPSPVLKPTAMVDYSNKDENKTDCASNPPESTSVSSSDLMTNNFPLKERNFLQKPRENTGSLNSGKENFKSQNTEDNIQCNEVSSSNIELDSLGIEEENDVQGRNVRHNLRSCRKDKSDIKVTTNRNESDNKNKGTKTKLDQNDTAQENPRPRKSMRIDNNLKKAGETVEKERRAFEAEEKLKKLAEKADLAKRKKSTGSPSSSLSQKLQNQYSKTKQKDVVLNKPIAKNKIKYMMNKVKRVQNKVIFRTESVKPAKNKKLMKNLKSIAEKAMLQKHNKKNASQRQRKVTNITETLKKTGPKLKPKVNSKSAENVTKINTPNLRQSSRHNSPSKSGPSGMVQKDLGILSRSEDKSHTRSLKKRLQHKTECLKQNVMKRK